MRKSGKNRRKGTPMGQWTVTSLSEFRSLACAHIAVDLIGQASRAVLLGLITHFRYANKSMGLLGDFEIGLKRLTLVVTPTNFSAHADGFLTAHKPARVQRTIQTIATEKERGGFKAELAPEFTLGIEGVGVKGGSVAARGGASKTRRAVAETIERARVQIRPVGTAIEVFYQECEGTQALAGQFSEKVRGDVRVTEEVRFGLKAVLKPGDYVVARRRSGVSLKKSRLPILHHLVLHAVRSDPEFKGPYTAEVSCSHGKTSQKR